MKVVIYPTNLQLSLVCQSNLQVCITSHARGCWRRSEQHGAHVRVWGGDRMTLVPGCLFHVRLLSSKSPGKGVVCKLVCAVVSQVWKNSTFKQRRRLLKTLLKFIIENQETICRCAHPSQIYVTRICTMRVCEISAPCVYVRLVSKSTTWSI